MQIGFTYGGVRGVVTASCEPMADPVAFGKSTRERGMPACTATVDFPAQGYWALLGWVQLFSLGAPSDALRWEADPFDLFADSTSPYAWFGTRPTLFDAPSHPKHSPVRFRARSFLATTPWDQAERLVSPLAGFEWGFDIDAAGAVSIDRPTALPLTTWHAHRRYLRERYDRWIFADAPEGADG